MHTGKEKQIYKKHIQVYSDVQKIVNEVHYVLKRKHKVNPITFPPIKSEGENINFTVEPLGTHTSILRTVSNVPTKFSYIFFKKNLCKTDSL